jgi:creatinine amidohydrolase/Fe(II)-dependent formamide hydrolase-like protein
LLLDFRPEVVREDRISDDQANRSPAYSMKPAPDDFIPDTGSFYKASHASAEIGERVSNNVLDALGAAIDTEWSD